MPRKIAMTLIIWSSASWGWTQMRIDYVAHACFIIEAPSGAKLALDPYNGNTWMGYAFPSDVAADAVAVTHPHYDHDASYYFGDVPVFREPGDYQIDDIRLTGVEGEHAGAPRFRQRGATPHNVIWVVEVDGVRLAHLGDNGPLSEASLAALGRIDILVARATGEVSDLAPTLERLGVRVLVPNHYRIPEISDLPKGLKSVDEWTASREDVVRHPTSVATYKKTELPERTTIHVFTPSTAVRAWPETLHRAWKAYDAGAALDDHNPQATAHYREAVELAPRVMKFRWALGRALAAREQNDEAIRVIEAGIARAAGDDWTDELRARAVLGSLYARSGETALAEAQYRWVLSRQRTYAAQEESEAREFLHRR